MKTRNLFAIVFLLFLVLGTQYLVADEPSATATVAAQQSLESEQGVLAVIKGYLRAVFEGINWFFGILLFWDVTQLFGLDYGFPFYVLWMIIGASFFTVRMGFINFRVFRHGFRVIRGKYSKPDDTGDVSHFQAFTTALSATVGLGNIAGVAIAISIGGAGATFWMIIAGLLGMTTKFTEATLAQMYRETRSDGHIMGGPMEYLSRGFAELKQARLGKVLAIVFCVFCIGGSLGAGNMFQVSQSMGTTQEVVPFFSDYPFIYGLILALLVGLVIIGGITRIAHTAEAIVPVMVAIYLLASFWIIFSHIDQVPAAFAKIFTEALTLEAGIGGLIGAIIQGFKRASFSNEAGVGSAAIAHAAAKSPYPVRQGIVALYEPFVDTVVICTITALVIIITGVYDSPDPEIKQLITDNKGAALTSVAFGSVVSWFPYILAVCTFLFAYSTMISWSYYGERSWSYMFGDKSSIVFKIIFVTFIVIGSIMSSKYVLDFSDNLVFAMAVINMVGLYVLHGRVVKALKDYMLKLKSGELDRELKQ